MADNYHTTLGFDQLLGSVHEKMDDVVIDRAIDGSGYARAFYTAPKDRFTLIHILSETERDSLLSFYASHRTVVVDLTWQGDGAVYASLFFSGPPDLVYLGRGRLRATVKLEAK